MYDRRPNEQRDARVRAEAVDATLTHRPPERSAEANLPQDHWAVAEAKRYHDDNNYQTIPTFSKEQRHLIEDNYQTIPNFTAAPKEERPEIGAESHAPESAYGRMRDVRALLEAQGRLPKTTPSAAAGQVTPPTLDAVMKARDKAYSSEVRSRPNAVPYTRIVGGRREEGVAGQGFRSEGKVTFDRASDTFKHNYGPSTYEFKVDDVVQRLAPGSDAGQLRDLIEHNANIKLQNGASGMTFEDRTKTLGQERQAHNRTRNR